MSPVGWWSTFPGSKPPSGSSWVVAYPSLWTLAPSTDSLYDMLGQDINWVMSLNCCCTLVVYLGSLSCWNVQSGPNWSFSALSSCHPGCWYNHVKFIMTCNLMRFPVPLAEKHPSIIGYNHCHHSNKGMKITQATIQRVLHKGGLHGCRPRKMLWLRMKHQEVLLTFARALQPRSKLLGHQSCDLMKQRWSWLAS